MRGKSVQYAAIAAHYAVSAIAYLAACFIIGQGAVIGGYKRRLKPA